MTVLLIIPMLLFLVLYLRERARNKNLHQEITYIGNRIGSDFYTRENGYVLVPSENPEIQKLSAQLNRLLEAFHAQRADYNRSRQAMTQVLTNISHDLRTPLTVLKGYSELLVKAVGKASVPADVQEMMARVDGKTDELVQTINEYFTLSKIDSGDMDMDLQRTNITAICHDIILDYYDILEREQFQVDIRIAPAPVFACADGEALKRILKNLIDNAIRHGGAGKYLGIRLEQDRGRTLIAVEDHGCGIAVKDQERIFFRNHTASRETSGNGLGLTIAKNLVLQMEGDISVVSEQNRKTVFTLTLKS